MTSQLYPTTRHLFKQIFQGLKALGLGAVLGPLSFGLMAMYITGLLQAVPALRPFSPIIRH